MKSIINKLVSKFYASSQLFLSGALLFGVFQIPFLPSASLTTPIVSEEKVVSIEETPVQLALVDEFLGKEVKKDVANSIIEKKIDFISSRPAYPASLAVIQRHENIIRKEARDNGVPEDVAIGVGLLENGGSETAKSPAGALGVFQLMPGTARNLGLTVNKKVDERKNPQKNIEAGMKYLRANFERFGDWGLATWAYHAGEGNVAKALKLYAKANHGITLPGVGDSAKLRAYVEKYDITIHKLLSSGAVKPLTKKLNDDSAGYPYKVIATAELFKSAKGERTSKDSKPKASVIPGLILEKTLKKI